MKYNKIIEIIQLFYIMLYFFILVINIIFYNFIKNYKIPNFIKIIIQFTIILITFTFLLICVLYVYYYYFYKIMIYNLFIFYESIFTL